MTATVNRNGINRETLDAVLVTLAYMGMKCENASTGVFTKKFMCEQMKSFELDIKNVCTLLNQMKEMI